MQAINPTVLDKFQDKSKELPSFQIQKLDFITRAIDYVDSPDRESFGNYIKQEGFSFKAFIEPSGNYNQIINLCQCDIEANESVLIADFGSTIEVYTRFKLPSDLLKEI